MTQTSKHKRTAASQNTEHPYGAEWVARQQAAARRNERDDILMGKHQRPNGHNSPRCLTSLVDGECVCR
jgi:hypothetical protein